MTQSEIKKAFGGRLLGTKTLKYYVTKVLCQMPEEIAGHITRDTWILGSLTDAWAYSFRGDEIAGKHLIVISDELFRQPEKDIYHTIAHEIGHIILSHRNSILVTQSKREIARQEREADKFAGKYLTK